ncbi:MAG: SpoIIE family protein phosphatase [Candidatus Mcinerneyibacterium aminivorans]|uniref:SpoIIE family protein phosphatase n=1 Tax=Candidatus Mcinerneyibacterium aminivorans TaxID=2703815 RepID=A0A5D0MK11_9BACT|nr:MAG: SpoIIE family protein phosphatase [Candidatus Mcinerneyibacterium aminivorans]
MNLRSKLIVYFIIIILVFLIVFYGIIRLLFVDNAVEKTEELIKVQNQNYVKLIDKKLNFIQLFVYNSSQNSIFWEQLNYNDKMIHDMSSNALKNLKTKYEDLISNIVLINSEREIVSSVGDQKVKDILKSYLPNITLDEAIFFKDFIFRDYGRNYYILFSHPIEKYGRTEGALVFTFRLTELFSELSSKKEETINIVYDNKGEILFHDNINLILNNVNNFIINENDSLQYINKEGKLMIGKEKKLSNDWFLLTLTSKDYIYSSINKTVYTTIFFMIATIIVGILFSYKFASNISLPIYNLVNIMKRIIKNNNYSIQLESKRNDEIGYLFNGFNRLVENINYHIEMEKIINKITKSFIFSSSNISTAINDSLKLVGEFFDLDRINLLLKEDSNYNFKTYYSWEDNNQKGKLKPIKKISLKENSKFITSILTKDIIAKSYYSNIDDDLREELNKNYENKKNAKSILVSRLYYNGVLNGLIIVELYDKNKLWSKEEKTVFSTLSEIIVNSLKREQAEKDLKRLNEILEQKVEERTEELNETNLRLSKSLEVLRSEQNAGRRIQFNLLPPQNQKFDGLHFSRIILPSLYLSGDFVDYKKVSEDYAVYFLADISGHGVASSFLTILIKNIFEHYYKRFKNDLENTIINPEQFVKKLNKEICDIKLDKYLVMFYGVIDLKNNKLFYVNAGQDPYPILYDGNDYEKLYTGDLPVGLFRFADYNEYELNLPEKFIFFAFSDGILEIMDEKQTSKQEEKLRKSIQSLDIKIQDVIKYFDLKSKDDLTDDLTFLMIKKS